MKVYVLKEDDFDSSQTIDIFDSLEKAQSYEGGKPEDWQTDINSRGWWSRILTETLLGGIKIKRYLGILEWEVK